MFTPTGFGLLLFGEEPRIALPQAGLLGTIHYPEGTEEIRNFEGPQVFVPEQAIQWLKDKLPNPIDRSEARRRSLNEPLFEVIREGIVNALVHRDYGIAGAKCQLVVTPETIEVRSPGKPVEPITLEQMQSFSAPMLSRNPILHYVFAQMALAEERGLGLRSIKKRVEEAKLPLPRYAWVDPYLVLTLFQGKASVIKTLSPKITETLKPDELSGWKFLTGRESVTTLEFMKEFDLDERKAQRILKKLVQVKLIRRIGKGPATRYEAIRK